MQYDILLPEDPAYATIGGFALARLGIIPRGGEVFDFENYRFTVQEMDRRRIAKLKIQKLPEPAEKPAAERKPASGSRK
jgi:CBS domain containing-hemolysin-like protein